MSVKIIGNNGTETGSADCITVNQTLAIQENRQVVILGIFDIEGNVNIDGKLILEK